MAEKEIPTLLEKRVISNRGLFVWVPDSSYRRFWLHLQLIRSPQLNYVSKKFNPDKSDYANITFMRQGMVLREERMQYPVQTFTFDPDVCGYLAKYLQCALTDIQNVVRNISIQLGIPTGTGEPLFCEPIEDQFDQIKIVVRIDGAIGAELYGLKYDINCPEATQVPQPPPPNPEFPNYPPGTGLTDTETPASPPYLEPNDDGDTSPLPEDAPPPEPGYLKVVYNIGANGSVPSGGEVADFFTTPDNTFTAELRAGTPPGSCASVPGIANPAPPLQETWIVSTDGRQERKVIHNTCNILSIVSQEYLPTPP